MVYNTNSSLHHSSPFREILISSSSKRELAFPLLETVFINNTIDDLAAEDAPPAEKFLRDAKKLFVDHYSTTTITFHG